MNLVSILIIAIPVLTLVVVTVQLVRALAGNVTNGKRVREELADQINELPFSNMLAVEGVDQNALLHRVSLVDVRQDIVRCNGCDEKQACKNLLDDIEQGAHAEVPDFCANQNAIQQHKLSM